MGKFNEMDLLKMAVDITASAVGNAGDKSPHNIANPQQTAGYIEAVFSKLKELNGEIA